MEWIMLSGVSCDGPFEVASADARHPLHAPISRCITSTPGRLIWSFQVQTVSYALSSAAELTSRRSQFIHCLRLVFRNSRCRTCSDIVCARRWTVLRPVTPPRPHPQHSSLIRRRHQARPPRRGRSRERCGGGRLCSTMGGLGVRGLGWAQGASVQCQRSTCTGSAGEGEAQGGVDDHVEERIRPAVQADSIVSPMGREWR